MLSVDIFIKLLEYKIMQNINVKCKHFGINTIDLFFRFYKNIINYLSTKKKKF